MSPVSDADGPFAKGGPPVPACEHHVPSMTVMGSRGGVGCE